MVSNGLAVILDGEPPSQTAGLGQLGQCVHKENA